MIQLSLTAAEDKTQRRQARAIRISHFQAIKYRSRGEFPQHRI